MKNRGQLFEENFRASCPPEALCLKLHTPVPPAGQGQAILALLKRWVPRGEEVPGWATAYLLRSQHTPPCPFDFLLDWTAPLPDDVYAIDLSSHTGAPYRHQVGAKLVICLELKSARGKRLDFSDVKPHVEAALAKAREGKRIAGLLIEFPDVLDEGAWFIPIENWRAHRLEANRASLSLDAARRMGVRLEIDPERGRTRTYFDVAGWLQELGAAPSRVESAS